MGQPEAEVRLWLPQRLGQGISSEYRSRSGGQRLAQLAADSSNRSASSQQAANAGQQLTDEFVSTGRALRRGPTIAEQVRIMQQAMGPSQVAMRVRCVARKACTL